MTDQPMTDMVIPPDAVEAAARVLHAQDCGGVGCEDLTRPEYHRDALAVLEAALPHLRPMLGRREAAEEIAAVANRMANEYQDSAVAHRDLAGDKSTTKQQRHWQTALAFRNKADGAWAVAAEAREIATKEPK